MITMSHSKWKCISRCARKYYYRYELELQPKKKGEGASRGSLIHDCLKCYYEKDFQLGAIKKPLKEYQKSLKKLMDEEKVLFENIPYEVLRLLRGYHHYWKDGDTFGIVKFQGAPVIEKEFILSLGPGISIKLIVDLLIQDDMGTWVMDHKSTKGKTPEDNYRTADAQSAIYFWGAQQLGLKPAGMMFNYLRTKPPTVPRLLKKGTLSKAKIDTDRLTYLEAITKHGLDVDDYRDILETLSYKKFFRRIKISRPRVLVKNLLSEVVKQAERIKEIQGKKAEHFPRSLTGTCDWDCRDYRPLCMADLLGHDTEFLIKTYYERREAVENKIEEEEEGRD